MRPILIPSISPSVHEAVTLLTITTFANVRDAPHFLRLHLPFCAQRVCGSHASASSVPIRSFRSLSAPPKVDPPTAFYSLCARCGAALRKHANTTSRRKLTSV